MPLETKALILGIAVVVLVIISYACQFIYNRYFFKLPEFEISYVNAWDKYIAIEIKSGMYLSRTKRGKLKLEEKATLAETFTTVARATSVIKEYHEQLKGN
jgi:hypothetical protein